MSLISFGLNFFFCRRLAISLIGWSRRCTATTSATCGTSPASSRCPAAPSSSSSQCATREGLTSSRCPRLWECLPSSTWSVSLSRWNAARLLKLFYSVFNSHCEIQLLTNSIVITMKLLAGSNFLQVCLEIGNNIQCRPSLIAPLLFSSFQAFRDKSEITQLLF